MACFVQMMRSISPSWDNTVKRMRLDQPGAAVSFERPSSNRRGRSILSQVCFCNDRTIPSLARHEIAGKAFRKTSGRAGQCPSDGLGEPPHCGRRFATHPVSSSYTKAVDMQTCTIRGVDTSIHANTLLSAYPLAKSYDLTNLSNTIHLDRVFVSIGKGVELPILVLKYDVYNWDPRVSNDSNITLHIISKRPRNRCNEDSPNNWFLPVRLVSR